MTNQGCAVQYMRGTSRVTCFLSARRVMTVCMGSTSPPASCASSPRPRHSLVSCGCTQLSRSSSMVSATCRG
eukprot:1422605-Pyramimonas_sp.AAC.1